MSFKSGFCNEYSTVRWTQMPGPLREAAGFSYQEFSNLRHPLALKGDPFGAGDKNQVSAWAEMLMPESAKVLASYDHPFFGRFAAITRNDYGKGTLTYEGTFLSDELQKQALLGVLQLARLTGPDQELPEAVTVKHGVGNSGKTLHFYLNFSSDAQKFAYPYGEGVEMFSEGSVRKGQSMTLAPWDVAIIEER